MTGPSDRQEGAIGTGEYDVQQGECVSSIAKRAGHFWETVWHDPGNADVRAMRGTPNVLLPGDRIHIPEKRPGVEDGVTEERHRFRLRGIPARLRVRLLIDGEPRANTEYVLQIDALWRSGQTDADGWVDEPIDPGAQTGILLVGPGQDEYHLSLGHLDPITDEAGLRERLHNLGYDAEGVAQNADEQGGSVSTETELRTFQREQSLEVTGEADEPTRSRLQELHGS